MKKGIKAQGAKQKKKGGRGEWETLRRRDVKT